VVEVEALVQLDGPAIVAVHKEPKEGTAVVMSTGFNSEVFKDLSGKAMLTGTRRLSPISPINAEVALLCDFPVAATVPALLPQ